MTTNAIRSAPGAGRHRLVTIIIPTFNERGNVRPLIERLIDSLAPDDAAVPFIDDSTDGTPVEIRECTTRSPIPVSLVHPSTGFEFGTPPNRRVEPDRSTPVPSVRGAKI